jgi:hypothetical protein
MGAPQKRKPRGELAGTGAVFRSSNDSRYGNAFGGLVKSNRGQLRHKNKARTWNRCQR